MFISSVAFELQGTVTDGGVVQLAINDAGKIAITIFDKHGGSAHAVLPYDGIIPLQEWVNKASCVLRRQHPPIAPCK